MKKDEYLPIISEKCQVPKNLADKIIDAYLEQLRNVIIKKDHVSITNVGVISKTFIKPKVIFSPIDGNTINNDGYYRITFKCSKSLTESLKNKS